MGFQISHIPVKAIYEGQKSGIKLSTFFPKVSLMLLIGLHTRIIRNTRYSPSIFLIGTWTTYVLGWIYNPLLFVITHCFDRLHVATILRDVQ